MKNNANDNETILEKIEALKETFENVKSIANKAQAAVIIAEHRVKDVAIARLIADKASASVKMMEECLKKLESDTSKK